MAWDMARAPAAAWVMGAWAMAGCHDEPLVYSGELPPPPAAQALAASPTPKPSVVLLRHWQGALIALACYDQSLHKLRAGDACAALIPDGAEVRLGDAHTVAVQRAPLLNCKTPSGEVVHPTFRVLSGPPADASPTPAPPLALWSSGPLPKLELAPMPPEPIPLPPTESRAISDSARLLLPSTQRLLLGEVSVDNVWSVDLDADGLRERLDQVRLFEVRGRFAMLTGVFVVSGLEAVALRPLRVQLIPSEEGERLGRNDHSHDATMLAALDLDHDGRRELWLQLKRPGFTTDTVGRFTGDGLATFAELTCPSLDPSPPAEPAAKPPPPATAQKPR
jgi:hypothetical protein